MSTSQGTYGRSIDLPEEYHGLPPDERAEILSWIWRNLKPTRTAIHRSSSYDLKHRFEDDTGLYIGNGAFKGAMLEAGYGPVDPKERNWRFRCTKARAA